jgi:hypothetical protein
MIHTDFAAWFAIIPTVLCFIVVALLPGFLVIVAARLPWFVAVAAAAPITVAIAAGGAIVVEMFGLPWNAWTFCGITLVAVLIAAVVGYFLRPIVPPWSAIRRRFQWATVGVLVAFPIAVVPFIAGIRVPDRPVQTWDGVFHLNAVQHILASGRGSSLTLGEVFTPGATVAYYPAGWHDLVSIVATPASVPLAANAASVVIAGLIWPIGLAFLTSVIFPNAYRLTLIAPILGSCFVAFPSRMLTYGTLWPNALATALLPSILALLLWGMRSRIPRNTRTVVLVVFFVALAGGCLAHPTALFAMTFLSIPLFIARAYPWFKRTWNRGRRAAALLAAVAGPILFVALIVVLLKVPGIADTASYPRGETSSHAQAVGEALFDSQLGTTGYGTPGAAWLLGGLTIVGLAVTLRLPGRRWLAFSYAISVGLYVLAMGGPNPLRRIVGFWYTDPVRLGGLVPLFGTVIASYGAYWVCSWLVLALRRRRLSRHSARLISWASAFTIAVIAIGLGTEGYRFAPREAESHRDYTLPLQLSWGLLSAGEIAMIDRVGEVLPPNSITLGNPFNGSAYLFSMSDRSVVFPHLTGTWSADENYLMTHFNELNSNPRVCALLNKHGVHYFYDDSRIYFKGNAQEVRFSKLSAKGLGSGLTEIDHGGTARLYRITACG